MRRSQRRGRRGQISADVYSVLAIRTQNASLKNSTSVFPVQYF